MKLVKSILLSSLLISSTSYASLIDESVYVTNDIIANEVIGESGVSAFTGTITIQETVGDPNGNLDGHWAGPFDMNSSLSFNIVNNSSLNMAGFAISTQNFFYDGIDGTGDQVEAFGDFGDWSNQYIAKSDWSHVEYSAFGSFEELFGDEDTGVYLFDGSNSDSGGVASGQTSGFEFSVGSYGYLRPYSHLLAFDNTGNIFSSLAAPQSVAVPEPSTMAILGLGFLGLFLRRKTQA